jgi:glycerophosphoryl diester phosphodiesterase
MRKAKECGAHSWETDVRMSKDGELIIFHYPTLESTTDISTCKAFKDRTLWLVNQFTAAELRELYAGSWFLTDDPFGTIASGEVSPQDQKKIAVRKSPCSVRYWILPAGTAVR